LEEWAITFSSVVIYYCLRDYLLVLKNHFIQTNYEPHAWRAQKYLNESRIPLEMRVPRGKIDILEKLGKKRNQSRRYGKKWGEINEYA